MSSFDSVICVTVDTFLFCPLRRKQFTSLLVINESRVVKREAGGPFPNASLLFNVAPRNEPDATLLIYKYGLCIVSLHISFVYK